MKHRLAVLTLLLAALILGGCSTFESRSRERSAAFASLDLETKTRLQSGTIVVGDSEDMVYIALGTPDEKNTKADAGGTHVTWTYFSYAQDYRGRAVVGYDRVSVYNPKTKSNVVYYEPVVRDIYQTRVEDRLRIEFVNGKVSSVEERQK